MRENAHLYDGEAPLGISKGAFSMPLGRLNGGTRLTRHDTVAPGGEAYTLIKRNRGVGNEEIGESPWNRYRAWAMTASRSQAVQPLTTSS